MTTSTTVAKKEMSWGVEVTEVQGFWYMTSSIRSIDAFRANFRPKSSDKDTVIVASSMKTGTTWLKALSHCILFRDEDEEDLLTKLNPHACVPNLESFVYAGEPSNSNPLVDPDQYRLLSTHMPYSYLPDSIRSNPSCKLVYITRDPKDTLVSQWHFYNKVSEGHLVEPMSIEGARETFCSGVMHFGPFFEHVLEYWEESRKSPEKVMFLKYEDLHRDPKPHVRKLASFLGKPFGDDDDEGEVEKVIWRSSFDRLKDLEVNGSGVVLYPQLFPHLTNDMFFRRGEVGDWRNCLTPEVAKSIDDVTRVKFCGTGLYNVEGEEEEVEVIRS